MEKIRQLGHDPEFTIRWFDADLREAPQPGTPGRWMAWFAGTAPNGMPWRRSYPLYGIPPLLKPGFAVDLTVHLPNFPGHDAPESYREHQAEFDQFAKQLLTRGLLDSELGAMILAGMACVFTGLIHYSTKALRH